jgi:prolyl oligopeptidase
VNLTHDKAPEPFFRSDGANVVGVDANRDAIVLIEQDVRGSHARRVTLSDSTVTDIALPFDADISEYASDWSGRRTYLRVEGWTDSPRWVLVSGSAPKAVDVFPDAWVSTVPGLRVEHVEVHGADGTLVPMTIVSGFKAPGDGKAPTILLGYGAFEVSLRPNFNALRAPWLEKGGIIAIGHVRGGGELGQQWHRGGMRERKKNSVDDFIACAEFLVHSKYTIPGRLAAMGGSAGGIVVGSAMVRRPELFRAVYIDSGILDILRFLTDPAGAPMKSEYGEPDTREHFDILRSLDAYQQLTPGTHYPAALLSVGLNDVRVPAWQSAKFIARLSEVAPTGGPFLLRTDGNAGHSVVTTEQEAVTRAELMAFFWWQMGLL